MRVVPDRLNGKPQATPRIEVLAEPALQAGPTYDGPLWLDRIVANPDPSMQTRAGFGAALSRDLDARTQWWAAQDDRHLDCGVAAQRVVINAVFVTAADAEHTRADDLGEAMADARRIAPLWKRCGKSGADAGLQVGHAQDQRACVGRLVAAIEIDCGFIAAHGWQVEGKQRSVGHGCGVLRWNAARRLDTDLLRDLSALRHSQTNVSHA